MAGRDWRAWHDAYDDPGSSLAQRLVVVVQARVAAALDGRAAGPVARRQHVRRPGPRPDPVLASHPRGRERHRRLVELDPGLAATARRAARTPACPRRVVTGMLADRCLRGLVRPAFVLACGVFGKHHRVRYQAHRACCTQLCTTGGTTVWTRGRRRRIWCRRSAAGSARTASS